MKLCNRYDKIVVTKDMLDTIEQTYLAYISNFILKYDFDKLNIEILFPEKINILVENLDKNYAMVTIFNNEKIILYYFLIYINSDIFSIGDIFIYDEAYSINYMDIIMFSINWYKKILFYKQWHTVGNIKYGKSTTFFVNTKKDKLKEKKSS